MADVPDQVSYGEVTGRFVSFRADGPDVGEAPDEVPLSGTVTLTPSVNLVRFPTLEPPRIAAISSVTAQVVNGDLKAPDGTGDLFVIATDQPLGQPDTVQWKATFSLAGATTQPAPVTFNVPAGGVVDLTTVIPAATQPGTVTVVSDEAKVAAEAAAARAEQARDDTEALLANADLSDTGWITFTPSSGWTTPSTGVNPQYRIKNGVVHFRGAVSSPAGGTGTKTSLLLPEETHPGAGAPSRGLLTVYGTGVALIGWVTFAGLSPSLDLATPASVSLADVDLSSLTWLIQ